MTDVGLQTNDAGHVGQNSSANVASIVGLQTETNIRCILLISGAEKGAWNKN